jgi:hypothetical protein
MNFTKLTILVVILGVMLIVLWNLQKKDIDERRQQRAVMAALQFPDLNTDDVFRLEVSSLQNESLLFRKEAGEWEIAPGKNVMSELMSQSPEEGGEPVVNPANDMGPEGDRFRTFYRANPDKVMDMISAIAEMPTGNLVTSNTEKQSTFGVLNAIVGTEVVLYDEQMNEIAHLIVGNTGSTFQTTYVRKPDSDDIYEVPIGLSMTFNIPMTTLRDRNIFSSAPETITSVSVNDIEGEGALTLNLERADGTWVGTDFSGAELPINIEKIDILLEALGNLSANSFVDMERPPVAYDEPETDDPYGVLNPGRIIEFTTADYRTYTLIIGDEDGSTHYATVDDYPDDVFRISIAVLNKISPLPESLDPEYVEPESTAPTSIDLTGDNPALSQDMEIPPEVLEELGL